MNVTLTVMVALPEVHFVTFAVLAPVSEQGKQRYTYKRWEMLFVNHATEKLYFLIWFTKVLSHRYIVEG